jgi:hypothetical protein
MLGHSRTVAILADVNANEFDSFREDEGFLQAERMILRLGNAQLTFHVEKGDGHRLGVAKNIVDNDGRIGVVIDDNAMRTCQFLPCTVDVVDEGNECGWAIKRPKRHDVVCPFRGIRSSEREFLLGA